MDQQFARMYSEDHLLPSNRNPVVVTFVFIGYIVMIVGLYLMLDKCFKMCHKQNEETNLLQYQPLNGINHPIYQSNSLV